MPFPTVPLVVKIEIAFGADLRADPATWAYTDCTADWQPDRDLAATIGRADAANKPPPAKLGLWLKNPGGKYTKGNPLSQFWPYIRKNTPVRVTLDPGTGHTRVYTMYITQWIPRWGGSGDSGRQPLVQVVANGVRRRLTQGSSPLRSPLYRAIAVSNPIAWWPLEDGEDSTQAASGLVGGTPMTVAAGVMDFVDDGPAGAAGAAKPDVTALNALNATISGGSSTAWQVSVWAKGVRSQPPVDCYFVPLEIRADSGKILRFILQQQGSGNPTAGIAQYNSDTTIGLTNVINVSNVPTIDGEWHLLQASITASGSDTVASFWLDGGLVGTATWTGITIGRPVRVSAIGDFTGGTGNISQGMSEIYIAPIGLWNTATLVNQWQAGLGYTGETAHDRLVRLGNEQGVPITASAAATTRMGPQRPAPFMSLLDECQDVDGGILLDGLGPGFTYLGRSDAYNLPIALTVDMAGRQFKAPFEPLDDDSNIVNDETVSRTNGSSARYIDDDSVAAIERYDDSKTINVYQDADLPAQAAWRTHLGTAAADGYRFPGVGFNLHTAAGAALIESWLTSGVRKRVQVTNPPAEYGPGPIDLLVEGYTETVRSRREWSVQANASPYAPWIVWQLGSLTTGRVNSASTTVRTTVPAGAASVQVNVGGVPWTTNPARMPLDLWIDGIKVRVTAISGAASPQTLTVDPTTVTKQLTAGRPVRLWQPAVVAL